MVTAHACAQKEYCSFIDNALFLAIVSDFDVSKPETIVELRATLEILKEGAASAENKSFDPSGTSGLHESDCSSSDRALSWHGDFSVEETEITALSRSLGSFDLGSDVESEARRIDEIKHTQNDLDLEQLSPEEKTLTLNEMFPTIKSFDIIFVLKKVDFEFAKALEELLNQSFLKEEESVGGDQIIKKSIDGFMESYASQARKKKSKRRGKVRLTADESKNPLNNSHSRWDRAKEDIEFITQRTHLSQQKVSSTYHKCGGFLASAIAALCASSESNPYLSSVSHNIIQSHISELTIDFPNLPLSQVTALIYLSYPSTTSARELARVLANSTSAASSKIVPQYLPRPRSPTPPKESPQVPTSLPGSSHDQLASARAAAFTQASTAYRKSKSTPLMAGAASYYSAVGRDFSTSLRRHEAAAAEALVSSQSKPGEIDLHGLNTKDAVRVAKERVESWWDLSEREWAREGKVMGDGLRVVTGVGRHSEGGKGRLGPAVGGMLVREGWKVEVGEGVLVVVGRARRR